MLCKHGNIGIEHIFFGASPLIQTPSVFQTSGTFRIRIYERPDFSGQMMEFSEDMPNLPERWRYREVHSCNVMEGAWVFYEHPNYRGRQNLLERGEFRRFSEWNAMHPNVGSIRRIQDFLDRQA